MRTTRTTKTKMSMAMNRPMINETLFNTEIYDDLREQMVYDLTADEMDQPTAPLMAMLEDFVWRMFNDMDDEVLQQHYDNLKEDKNE